MAISSASVPSASLSEGDFRRLLELAGFGEDPAADLADIYAHGRHLLQHRRGGEQEARN